MNHYRTMSLALLAVLLLGTIAGFATAQTPYPQPGSPSAPGAPGAPGNPVPPGSPSTPGTPGAPAPTPGPTTTGPTLFGMSTTTAVVVGLILLLVIILAIVAVSRNDTTAMRPY